MPGSILICGAAILVSAYLVMRSQRKRAAVGRREMQLFLLGYIIIEICEIFTVGEFPLASNVRIVSRSTLASGCVAHGVWKEYEN